MEQDLIKYLESIGAIEYCFTDDDGDRIYRFTKEAQELVPDLYREHMNEFNQIVFALWNKGLIDVHFDDNGEPLIGLNENSVNMEMINKLEEEEKDGMLEILAVYENMNKE